jgi:hypothetical protein
MLVCVKCRVKLTCEKVAVGVAFHRTHVYAGDRLRCPKCGFAVISTVNIPYDDPDRKGCTEYIDMPEPEEVEEQGVTGPFAS